MILALAARRRVHTPSADLARAVLAASVTGLLIVYVTARDVSFEARHLLSAGAASLPLALAEGRALWFHRGALTRAALSGALAVYVGDATRVWCGGRFLQRSSS